MSGTAELAERYRAALQRLKDAQAEHDVMRDEMHRHLRELGRMLAETGEPQINTKMAQQLYWEMPRIHASAIGAALGVYATDVHKVIRSEPYIVTCRACGTAIERRPKSRTSTDGTSTCSKCTEENYRRHQDERRQFDQQERERNRRRMERIEGGGYWIDSEGEVVAHDVSHWCRGCGSETYPSGDRWHVGAIVTYVCRECGAQGKHWAGEVRRTLVKYVPTT